MKEANPKQTSTSPENASNEPNIVALFQLNPTPMWIREEGADNLLAINNAALTLFGEHNHDVVLGKISDWMEISQASENLIIIKNSSFPKFFKRTSLPIIWNGQEAICDYILPHTLTNPAIQDFQNAVDKASIVSLADKAGIITYVNENFINISGYSSQELIGQNHHIINSNYHPKSFWAEMWKTIVKGKTWRAEVKNRAKDGSYYWVDTFIMPFLDENGQVREFLSIRNDITSRKSAEQALILSRNKLSEALQFGNMGSASFYPDTNIIDLSIELLKMLGIDSHERIKTPLDQFIQKHIVSSYQDLFYQKIGEGIKKSAEGKFKLVLSFDMLTITGKALKIEAKGVFDKEEFIGIFHDVSDRVEAEAEVLKRGRVLHTIFNGVTDGFFALDHELNFLLVNHKFSEMAQMNSEEMVGKNMIDLFPFMKGDALHLFYQKILNEKKQDFLEHINPLNPNQIFHINAYYNPDGLFIYFKDVSIAKNAELELRESQNRLSNIVAHLPGIFYRVKNDVNYTCIYMSHQVKDLTGYETLEFTNPDGISFGGLIHPHDVDRIWEETQKGLEKNEFYEYQYRVIHKSGEIRWVQEHGNGVFDQDNNLLYLDGFVRDITLEKNTQEEIKKLSLIASGTHSSVVFTDAMGYITWVNKSFEKISEYTLEEVIGKKPGSFLQGPETNPKTIAEISSALKRGNSFTAEILNYSKSGNKYWLMLEVMPSFDELGQLSGFMSVQSDITALKQATEEAISARNQLQTIMDHAPMVVFMKDAQGKYQLFNKMYRDFIGKELPLGITDYDIFDTEFANSCKSKDEQVISTGDIISFEHLVGNQTFYETKFPIRNEKGEVYALGGMSIDITQIKALQHQVSEHEQRIQSIAQNIPNGVVYQLEMDAKGESVNYPYVSKGSEKLFGLSPEEAMANSNALFDIVHKDDIEKINNEITKSQKTLRPFSIEHRVVLKNNKISWLLSQGMPRLKPDGGTIWDGIAIDITKTKKLELALKASEASLQNIFHSMISGVVVVDMNGEITYANKSAADILSLETEKIEHRYFASKEWRQIDLEGNPFPPEKLPLSLALVNKEQVFNLEHGIIAQGENVKWLNVNASPIFDNKNQFIGAVASFVDITKRKESERELNETLLRINAISNNIPNGAIYQFAVSKNGDWSVPFISDSIHNMLGINAIDVLKDMSRLLNRIHPQDFENFQGALILSKEDLSELHDTCRFKNIEGNYRHISAHAKPRLLADGTTIWDGVLMDESESWELMDSLEKTHTELEELLAEKDVLIREIHHRVKNNLQVMSSVLFLKAQTLKDPDMRQLLIESRQRLRSMAIIHERLMQSGGKITKIDIHDYIHSLVSELQNAQLINAEYIKIELDIAHEMLNLEQVVNCGFIINEAVTNSLKYAFPNGRRGIIRIQFNVLENNLELVVSDNGVGLPGHANLNNTELFGMQLIKVFTNHLHGKVLQDGTDGTKYTIRF